MAEVITYTCSSCGMEHEDWLALAHYSPDSYHDLSEEEREHMAELDSDFCIIRYPDQTDRFIRCTLTQKVTDHCENLEYGFWTSVNEKSFQDYSANFNNEAHVTKYSGWLSSQLLDYDNKEPIPVTVYTRPDGRRPEVVPSKDFDHPFVRDYYNGITKKEAERRIAYVLG